ncbi:hypothetical protein C8R43DRAFT_1122713 [Mycena crocata]|nr:hypothetical protein C8R43DRAFT_1122713 [Mycena crocata]
MSTNPETPLRDVPPHLDQQVNHPAESAPPVDTTIGRTSVYVSACYNTAPAVSSETADSRSPGELTASLNHPSGLRVKLRMDANGCHYMLEEATRMRFDFSDDELILTHTPYYAPPTPYRHPNARMQSTSLTDTRSPPSEPSDLLMSTESGTQRPTPEEPPERVLEALVGELSTQLSPEQRSAYSTIHTMITTGRAALLTTTAFVVNQHTKLKETSDAVDQVWEETNKKLISLHTRVEDQEEAM